MSRYIHIQPRRDWFASLARWLNENDTTRTIILFIFLFIIFIF